MNDSKYPKISIVTPSFNQCDYLRATIESILDQGYPNLEYFVVDGDSNDGSVDVIKSYQSRLARWVSEHDKGQTDAINKGLCWATGDILGFVNSDDCLLPGSLAAAAASYSRGAKWFTGAIIFVENGKPDRTVLTPPLSDRVEWLLNNPINQPSTFFSKELYSRVGPFRHDLHYVFDYELWLRIIFTTGILPEVTTQPLSRFRLHTASKTMSQYDRFIPEIDQCVRLYRKYLSISDRARLWSRLRAGGAANQWNLGRRLITERKILQGVSEMCRSIVKWPPLCHQKILRHTSERQSRS